MMSLLRDSNGKVCLAKLCYIVTLCVCLYRVTNSSCTIVDYSGMAMLLGVVAGTYYGRADTKAKKQ